MGKGKIRNIEGFPMYLSKTLTGLSAKLHGDGFHEPAFMWLLRKEAKGNLALDIGSNIGYSTLSLCKNMKRVIAIEPDDRSRKVLKHNLKLNNFRDKVDIRDYAISDVVGRKDFYISKHPNLSAFHKNKKFWFERRRIKTVTIDSLNVLPNFIKMDLEGHEVEVIRGGMNSLDNTKFCRILLEVHPSFYTEDHTFADSMKDLFDIGYNVKYLVSAGVACPDEFKNKGYKPFKIFEIGGFERGIYREVTNEDALNFATKIYNQAISNTGKISKKIVRAIMLEKDIL